MDEPDLLRVLDAYGQEFLNRFSPVKRKSSESSADRPSKSKRALQDNESDQDEDEFEEWHGIENINEETSGEEKLDSGGGTDIIPQIPRILRVVKSTNRMMTPSPPPTARIHLQWSFSQVQKPRSAHKNLLYTQGRSWYVRSQARIQGTRFILNQSSKISRLREGASVLDKPEDEKAEDDEKYAVTAFCISLRIIPSTRRTNAQNDALLHRLIHTTLLSGSLNPELDMTSAERRRALSGRVLELTGDAKLGKGETKVKITERNKAAKRVREGLWKKQRERELKQLEEVRDRRFWRFAFANILHIQAKNMGNYHPSIKKLFEGDGHPSFRPKKRTRGLKMGVGRFSAGTLRLSQKDVSAIEGGHTREPTGRRGKVKHKSPKRTSPP